MKMRNELFLKKKIAIDIDEVLVSFIEGFSLFMASIGFKKLFYEEFTSFDLETLYGVSRKEILQKVIDYTHSSFSTPPKLIEGSLEGIKKLKESFDIIFITGRPISEKESTLLFIAHYFSISSPIIYFSNEIFENETRRKDVFCKELGISLIVEDSEYSYNYAVNGITVLLLDKPWNQKIAHKNIFRCMHWNHIILYARRHYEI